MTVGWILALFTAVNVVLFVHAQVDRAAARRLRQEDVQLHARVRDLEQWRTRRQRQRRRTWVSAWHLADLTKQTPQTSSNGDHTDVPVP